MNLCCFHISLSSTLHLPPSSIQPSSLKPSNFSLNLVFVSVLSLFVLSLGCSSSDQTVKMLDTIIEILTAILQVAAVVWREFKYLRNYNSKFEELREAVGNLKIAKLKVDDKTDAAYKNLEEIEQSVSDWQTKVGEIIRQAEALIEKYTNSLEQEIVQPQPANVARGDQVKKENVIPDEADKSIEEKAKRRGFMRFFGDLMTRYKDSKTASTMVKTIEEVLKEEKEFTKFSHPRRLQDVKLVSDRSYQDFDSRNFILHKIVEALKSPTVNIVGVFGMGGVGKTMLVKAVGRKMKEDKTLFDKVVFVEVRDTPNIKEIQNEIADQLEMKLAHDEPESTRKKQLLARLTSNKRNEKENERMKIKENDKKRSDENIEKKNKENDEMNDKKNEKILLILDDIWEDSILETIGIPSADLGESKVLLTARERTVLEKMVCELFQVDRLSEQDAWKLFVKMTGDFIEQRELKSLAHEVCTKCGGLPIAIVTVAKALSNKTNPSEWSAALEQFQSSSPENFEGDLEQAYLSVELSYNYLRGEELKQTFLLCSLMGHEATILDLLKYVMGLNIFEGIYTMQKARDKLYTFIRKLKDSCLLLDGPTSESFSMHDFVREVAISIVNKSNCLFYVRNDTNQWEWPHNERLKVCEKIFIRDSDIGELPEGLECPQLQSLFMNTKLRDSRFQSHPMPAFGLKNTNLDNSQLEIPQEFFTGMTKLKVLDLNSMHLFSLKLSLHHLMDLQTLCLNFCKFEDDVAIIGELTWLKILSLQGSNVKLLPKEIAKLTKLRLLDLSNCRQLKVIAPKVISSLFRLEELYMGGCFVQWEVEGYNGERINGLEELKLLSHLTTLELDLQDEKILPQGLFSKEMKRYKISIGNGSFSFGGSYIFGDRCSPMLIKSFSFQERRTFSTLRMLKLKHNSTISLEELQGFKNVEFLCLDKLHGVSNILYELDKEGFSQLKHIRVHNNLNLVYIIDMSISDGAFPAFPLLESLVLFNLIKLKNICCGQLTSKSFRSLKFVEVQHCVELDNIFSLSDIAESLPQLQMINVNDCPNVKEIFAIESADNTSNFCEETDHEINLCQLRFLTLRSLPRLTSFYSEVKPLSTLQLRELRNKRDLENEKSLFNEKVVFNKLEVLDLGGLNMERIWSNQLQTYISSSDQHLTHLTIQDCEKLKYVFLSSIVKSFKKLQHLEIWNCKVLKEIVSMGERAKEDAKFVKAEWPALKKLKVWNCDKLQICTLEHKVDFPNLEVLDLNKLDIEKIWDDPIQASMSSSYKNLTHLTIKDCEKLKYVFPSSLVKSFKQLQHLEIRDCNVLKEVVATGGGASTDAAIVLPKMTSLALQHLTELTTFYSGVYTIQWPMLKKMKVSNCDQLQIFTSECKVVSPNLEALTLDGISNERIFWDNQLSTSVSSSYKNLTRLTVMGCEKLKYMFPFSVVETFKQLQHLEIWNCKFLQEIVAKKEGEAANVSFVFPKVTFLKLQHLPELMTFYPRMHASEWPMLKRMMLSNCDKLKIFTSEYKVVCPSLEALTLDGIDTEKICWDNQLSTSMSPSFKILTRLILMSCEKIKYVFSFSMVKTLKQLQHLEIWNCNVLEEIVAKEGRGEADVTFVFPKVTFLKLYYLPKLTALYPERHTSEWPSLKKMEVSNCGKLQIFTSEYKVVSPNLEFLILGGSNIEKMCWDSQAMTSGEKINPTMEEVILGGKSSMMMWQGQFRCLKVFEIHDDKSVHIPLGILPKFNNLERLKLNKCSYKELFSCGEEGKHTRILREIKSLKLKFLPNLKYMWKQDSKLDFVFQNLEILKVRSCDKLIQVVPPSTLFHNLTVLDLDDCHGLVNLITYSTAKSLVQLTEMKIKRSKMMIEIVENKGDAAKDEIVFSRLKSLSLEYLGSLTCFYSGNYTFNFPSLEELIVDKCPKMKTFSRGEISTPRLHKVIQDCRHQDEGYWMGDLNTTIQQLHEIRVNSNLEELTLSGRDVKQLWQGQFPENISELKVLEIIKDESTNISIEVLQRFINLENLILKLSSYEEMFFCEDGVRHYGTLKQIKILELWGLLDLKYMWKQASELDSILQNLEILEVHYCHGMINLLPSSASFGNLTTLKVRYCDGLKYLVTSSVAKCLVQLENIVVGHCETMTEVVANEGDAEKDEIVFNKLKLLSLEYVGSLTCFGFGSYSFTLPALEEVIVVKCPKMEIFFGGILSTPSLNKVKKSESDLEGYWEGDLNTTIQHLHNRRY